VYAFHPDKGKVHAESGPRDATIVASASGEVYAVCADASFWRRAGHDQWEMMNEKAVPEDPWALGADPQVPGLVWIGVSPAMIYRSADAGSSWEACDSFSAIPGRETWTFPPPPHIPHVRSIHADPKRPGAVYVGVEEGGVFYSADGGATWNGLNEGLFFDIHEVLARPQGERMFATTGYGFHRSDDGGKHWELMMQGLDRTYTIPLVTPEGKPERLYTAAAATPPPGWRTAGSANAGIYRSDDGGGHWRHLGNGLPERIDTMIRSMIVGSDGTLFASTSSDLYVSEDEGETWSLATDGLPNVRSMVQV
jgi:photosystem II stability/assembly factor-like uncharacterized protein